MKKVMAIGLLIIAAIWLVSHAAFLVHPVTVAMGSETSNRPTDMNRNLPDLIVPPLLPAAIQDRLLLEAWVRLYNEQEPVQLPDGRILTGRGLAQFLLEEAIPVEWDTENVCNGDSCSVNYCRGEVCTHEDGQPGIDPIYISLYYMTRQDDRMRRLVESLAHEIFHRMEPYGQVRDSQYEEFTAMYIAAQISGSTWQDFKGYDPYNPVCLERWFNRHGLPWYLNLPAYPQSVAAALVSPQHNDCTLEGDLECQVTMEGYAMCKTAGP